MSGLIKIGTPLHYRYIGLWFGIFIHFYRILHSNRYPSRQTKHEEFGKTLNKRSMTGTDRGTFEQFLLESILFGHPHSRPALLLFYGILLL